MSRLIIQTGELWTQVS